MPRSSLIVHGLIPYVRPGPGSPRGSLGRGAYGKEGQSSKEHVQQVSGARHNVFCLELFLVPWMKRASGCSSDCVAGWYSDPLPSIQVLLMSGLNIYCSAGVKGVALNPRVAITWCSPTSIGHARHDGSNLSEDIVRAGSAFREAAAPRITHILNPFCVLRLSSRICGLLSYVSWDFPLPPLSLPSRVT